VNTDTARSTFHLSPILDANAKPLPAQMWYAQVGLWVQQDVINAIATLNEEAAKQLKPDDVYVENMPVKRIQSIRVLGYWGGNGPVAFPTYTGGGPGSGAPPAQMKETFTGRKSDARFDVIRFTVTAVVDQRELPKLIDFLTRQNFYTLIGLSFSAVTAADPDLSEGYLYGAAPVVRATLDFEGYLARSVYEGWFPDEVREALGIKGGP
jgi:hypothetical protein